MAQTDPLKDEQPVVEQPDVEQPQQPAPPGTQQTPPPPSTEQPKEEQPIAEAVVDAQAQQNGTGGTSTTTTITETVEDDPAPPQIEGEEDLLKYLEEQRDANRRLTPDEVKKLRRKQRTEEIISGISDAVMSLSNLYFTSQYAPSMYDHTKGMSEATKARWDKAWKEREAENDRYLNFALKGHGIRAQRAATLYQHQQDKIKADREDRKQDRLEARDAWQAQARQLELEIKQAQIAGNQELANQKLEELKRHNQAMERNGYISATRPCSSGGGGGGGSRSTPYSITVYGQTEYFNKPQERETAIYGYARELGIPTTTTTGTWPNNKEVKRNINDVAADIESQTRGKSRPGRTSGGSNSGKKHADL